MVEEIDKILNDKKRLTALARTAFNEVDTDRSGEIDEGELKTVMGMMSKSMGTPKPSNRQVEMLYKELDTDGNGMVDFEEFMVLIRKSLEAVRARKLGQLADEDEDDSVNEAKLRRQQEEEEERKRREAATAK